MIADLRPGDKVTDFFIVRRKELRARHDGEELYLSLELGDASARIFGSLWDNVQEAYESLQEGKPAKVRASVIEWQDRPHLNIIKIRPVTPEDQIYAEDLMPKSSVDPKKFYDELLQICDDMANPYLQQLVRTIYQDPSRKIALLQAPGGKLWHHNYEGGLLEHTWQMVRIVQAITELYPNTFKDLLLAGALLHDVGKIYEYEHSGYIDYSDVGRLHGHIAIGYHLVASEIEKIENFPSLLREHLLHLILAHQGQLEHGSPVVPVTREAIVLHFVDEIDSQLNAFDRIAAAEKGDAKKWSRYVRLLDRFLFIGEIPRS